MADKLLDLNGSNLLKLTSTDLSLPWRSTALNRLLKNSQQNVVLTEIHQVLAQAGISMSVGRLITFFDEDTRLSALAADVAQKTGNPERIFRSGKPESRDIP